MAIQASIFFRPYQLPKGVPMSACTDVAHAMDEAGLHSVLFGDHLLLGTHSERYPYGPWKHPQESSWPEPLTTLAAMAAVTKTIKLATGILLAPLRSALVLAKSIATLDVMSDGRTQLALGVGWQPEEYTAVGIPFEERYKRLDEVVDACRALWGEQPVHFKSANVDLDGVWSLPLPIQPRVPLLYGLAMTPKNAARMATRGDGWCPVGLDLEGIREGVVRLGEALRVEGRDLSTQHVRVGLPPVWEAPGKLDVERTFARAPEFVAAGGTIMTVESPPEPESMSEMYRFVDRVAKAAETLG